MNLQMRLLCLLLLSFLLFSCKKLKPVAPDFGEFDELPPLELSTLNIPIQIEIKELAALINKQLKQVLYEDTSFTNNNNDGIKLRITRLNKIDIRSRSNKFYFQIPLQIEMEALLKKKVMGREFSTSRNINFSANLHLSTSYRMNKDWQLITHIKLDRIEWISRPDIKVIGIKFDLTKLVERKIKEKEEELLVMLDTVIKEKVNLKSPVEKIWADLQKPIRINRQVENVWLRLEPQSIKVSPIRSNRKEIYFDVHLNSYLSTLVGDSPTYTLNTQLPDFEFKNDTLKDFKLNLKGLVPFTLVNRVLKDSLVGREILIQGKTIRIKEAKLSGSGNQIVLKVKVGGAAKGLIYITGKPELDSTQTTVQISNFNFDLHSEEILIQAADWIYHSDILEKAQAQLQWNLQKQITMIPELIGAGIGKGKLKDKITLDIDTMKVLPSMIVVRPEGIYLLINAEGMASLKVNKLKR